MCRLTQNFVWANTKFCVHKTNFPPTRPFVIEFIVIVTPSYRLEIPTSLIEMSTYQGPTPTLPRSANTCYATTHRRRLGALSYCRLPCRSTAEATITSTSYRRCHNNCSALSSQYPHRRIIIFLSTYRHHCDVGATPADATIKFSSSMPVVSWPYRHRHDLEPECNNQILVAMSTSSWCHSRFVADVSSSS